MSPLRPGRLLRGVSLALAGGALGVVAAAPPAAAHAAGGPVPAPPWLLAYLGAALVLATAVAVRAGWLTRTASAADALDEEARRPHPVPVGPGNLLGLALVALVVAAGVVGPDSAASNVAPVAVYVSWLLVPLLSLVLGDVVRALNPFVPLVRAVEGERSRLTGEGAPIWIPAALLASVSWFFLAYHRPGSPRALVVFLAVYAVVVLALGLRYGSRWVRAGEGLAALSAAVSTVAPIRRSPAPPGTAAVVIVWIGSVAFDGLTSTPFWDDVIAGSIGWERTVRSTLGLAWMIALVGIAYLGALWAARSRIDPARTPAELDLRLALGAAIVPVGLAWFIGHDLSLILFEGQNLIALLSDPIGRGWDLLGTVTDSLDYGLAQEAWVSWVQIAALGLGHVAAVVLTHRTARAALSARGAMTVTWAVAALCAVSVAAGALLLL